MKLRFVAIILLVCLSLSSVCLGNDAHKKNSIKLVFSGLSGDALKNVENRLNAKKGGIAGDEPNIVIWNFFRDIPSETKRALEPYGYFAAKVNLKLLRQKKLWLIKVRILPGQRMRFHTVSIKLAGQGRRDPVFVRYLASVTVHKGAYFDSESYEKIKKELQNIASNRGYFQVKFVTHKLTVDLKNYTASIELDIRTGHRSRIGETKFSDTGFKSSLLKRYLAYQHNEPYKSTLLEKTRQNLIRSNFFQSVIVIPKPSKKKGVETPIDITLRPQDQVTYTFGAGYGTDTSLRGLANINLRWINAAGHSVKGVVRGSQRNEEVALSYLIPGRQPAVDTYMIQAALMHLDLSKTVGSARSVRTSLAYLTKLAQWKLNTSLTYQVERYSLINFPIKGFSTKTNASVLYPQITLQRTYAEPNLINASYGYNITISAAGGSKEIGSKANFTRSQVSAKLLFTINKTHTRFFTRLKGGAITIDNLVNLPFSLQFYAGGSQSIRGFEYNSIGPGRVLLTGSIEMQQEIMKNFYLAGFVDVGNVSNRIFKSRLKLGSGPAIAYTSPIGTIELSIAKDISSIDPITRKHNGKWRVHVSLGTFI